MIAETTRFIPWVIQSTTVQLYPCNQVSEETSIGMRKLQGLPLNTILK